MKTRTFLHLTAAAIVGLAVMPDFLARSDPGPGTVLICGDSLMKSVARSLVRELGGQGSVRVEQLISIGTGLARPDVFDWPAKLRESAASRPAYVVILLGANDDQALRGPNGQTLSPGTPEWTCEYTRRVAEVLGTLDRAGVGRILWIGLPDMRDAKLQEHARRVNEIFRSECGKVARAEFFDIAPLFSPKPGTFTSYSVLPGGKVVTTRASDGIHFTADGADLLARAVRERLKAR